MVRAYVRTRGHSSPSRDGLTLTTLVRAADRPLHGLDVEALRVMRICRGPLSIAEIASLLDLPPTVALIVVSGLLDTGHLDSPAPAGQPDISVLEEVLNGLRALAVR
ncbi:DUF742 domain-containing protein [Streptomyces diastatochromogenes]|uniref:DUF742 domain-containing protein n=1 Tax=Streptomyces diastatochromogenes TaxID=42236 RepID=A0A233S8A7_STRDA|nr:DUF742 domain-containing protein [Streptomyces diastatochromogenes]MCZ0990418.1 DUF742 domain-containing protein [Streptomyces diastatochromogenes]OXY91905.1 hypothetical protein BEK98_27820 [Streptomyces diastatochromogenes]